MRHPGVACLLLIASPFVPGCTYRVAVRGVTVAPGVETAGNRVWVTPSPARQPGEVAATSELVSKIELLLEQRGYRAVAAADADLALLFEASAEAVSTRKRLQPPSGSTAGMETSYRDGPFERRLSLRLVRAAPFLGEAIEETLWTGVAVIHDAPTDGPNFNDLLLVAAFEQFPRDTGKTVEVRLRLDTPEARRLRNIDEAASVARTP